MYHFADLHCDTISALYNNNCGNLRNNNLHVDLDRLKNSNYILQTFALFQDISNQEKPYEYAKNLLSLYNKEINKNSDLIKPILYKEDLNDLQKNGKIGALLTLEEGEACLGDLDILQEFFDSGVRLITLTWNNPNSLGYPNRFNLEKMTFEPETEKGLTSKGIEFLKKMEELGIIPDVSHLSDKGFYDVYNNTSKPFMASHSNARSITNHPRNLKDDMIQMISDRGGVIGLNFCGDFMDSRTGYATIEDIIKHAKYIKDKGGIDVLAFGSDFDGIPDRMEISDCSKMPLLINKFEEAGFNSEEIEKITSKNVLRVLEETLPEK